MESCKKLALVLVSVAVIALATLTPTAVSTRNELVMPALNVNPYAFANPMNNIRNPMANAFMYPVVNGCVPKNAQCGPAYPCCDNCYCAPLGLFRWNCVGTCSDQWGVQVN